jgi:hypothetical protein
MSLLVKYDSIKHALNLLEEKFCFQCEHFEKFPSSKNDDRFKCNYHNILKEENAETTSCDHWKYSQRWKYGIK